MTSKNINACVMKKSNVRLYAESIKDKHFNINL
jgi:hypothetical protein